MATLKEGDTQDESRDLSMEVSHVMAVLKEKITQNTQELNKKGSISERQLRANMIKEDQKQLQILEAAKSNNQFNTPAVNAILRQYKNAIAPEPESPQAVDSNKSFSIVDTFRGIRQKLQDWQKSPLDAIVKVGLASAQANREKLSIRLKQLSENTYAPTLDLSKKINEEKSQISEQIKFIDVDIQKLSNYKNENKSEINNICNKYKPEKQTTQTHNQVSRTIQNSALDQTINQMIDIGLQRARAELDKISLNRQNLDKAKIFDPTGQYSKVIDEKKRQLSEKINIIVADIEKLLVYKDANKAENKDEISKICNKYNSEEPTPQAGNYYGPHNP